MSARKLLSVILIITVLGLAAGCSESIPSQSGFVLGTLCTITLYDKGRPQVYRSIFSRLQQIEDLMNTHAEGSDVDRINKSAGIEPVKVHDDVFEVIERALYYAEISGGALDLTVQPLVSLWDIGGEHPRVPAQEEIDNVLPLINWRYVELDKENKTVFLKKPGMALDLGAIAKGYAADEAAAIIRKARIPRAVVDLGGNILTVGEKEDKSLWRIGIQNPRDSRGAYIGVVQVKEKTVVTSGVYERYFVQDGVRYHHIFSPQEGFPVRNGLLSVSIIGDSSMDADALSTAAFVLGYEKGRALIESLEGVEAIFLFEDQTIRMSTGVDFVLRDDNFRIVED